MFYLVETALLQSMTDQMTPSNGSFTSVVRVWSGQRRERDQANLIVGEDNTMERHTRVALLHAWCVWHAVRLCESQVKQETWCFTPGGFDGILERLQPALRAANLQRSAEHARARCYVETAARARCPKKLSFHRGVSFTLK